MYSCDLACDAQLNVTADTGRGSFLVNKTIASKSYAASLGRVTGVLKVPCAGLQCQIMFDCMKPCSVTVCWV